MSQLRTAARQCLYSQGHIEHLPLPERFQQLPTMHRRHVDVYSSCVLFQRRTIILGKAARNSEYVRVSRCISVDHHI